MADADIEAVIRKMKSADKRAIMTRDGQGEFTSVTLKRLMALGLVEGSLRFTDLGWAVRDRISPTDEGKVRHDRS